MGDTIALMRKRLLDMAIRGELVEQRPGEGNAEDSYKSSKLPEVMPADRPFEIPVNWRWVQLGSVGVTQTGNTPPKKNKEYYNGNIPFVKPDNIYNDHIDYDTTLKLTNLGLEKGRSVQANSILMVCIGTIGKTFITDKLCAFNQQINSLTPYIEESYHTEYLFRVFESSYFQTLAWDSSSATTINILNKGRWNNLLLPLPPLAEQNRIVTKIEEIFAVIDQIGTKKEEALSIIRSMRQTALQDAIMGVLVEQEDTDEPASVLYEKIQTEKEQMVKDKKMKKEKPLPAIDEDEIPFEIPESWKWVRLGNIILSIFGGGTPSKAITSYWNGDIPWATVKDISDRDTQLYSTIDFITEDGFNNCSGQMVSKGDIIVITRMGLGRAVISCIDTAINQDLKGIKLPKQLNSKYFLNAYKSISIKGTGTTVKGIKQSSLLNACIPLPPLNEQNRIVEKLDEILAICDQMEATLDGSADMVAERIY